MAPKELHVVTGAFGYSGQYIARRLLAKGHRVRTLTNTSPPVDPFAGRVEARPLTFDDPSSLVESLKEAKVLYNTYWVRFTYKHFSHAQAVENTLTLFDAARKAVVERIVHVSITNPSEDSHLEYFQGKARLEKALVQLGIPYSILRPAILFGKEDILINNIAWMLRRFPVFGVFGDGHYRLQPIHVDDFARLAVEQGEERNNVIINAIGPETFTYRQLVEELGRIIGHPRPIFSLPSALGLLIGKLVGLFTHDVVITRDEIEGLMAGLLQVDAPAAGKTKLTDWVRTHRDSLGRVYANELSRRRAGGV